MDTHVVFCRMVRRVGSRNLAYTEQRYFYDKKRHTTYKNYHYKKFKAYGIWSALRR